MIEGYEYQSDFARKYYGQGVEQGLRQAIIALVCKKLPGLREELEERLRGQPEKRLSEILDELGGPQDEAAVRAVLERHS